MNQRMVSGIVALTYLVVAGVAVDGETAMHIGIFLVLPLGLIWFSDDMGGFSGFAGGTPVSSASPGWMLAAGGWVLLLIPLMFWLIVHFASNG